MKRAAALVIITITMCMSLASQAIASTLTWNLVGVTFSDGGVATGSFGYDADTDSFSNVNIATTAGSTFGGATYTDDGGFGNNVNLDFRSPIDGSDLDYGFAARLAAQMRNTGGTIDFVIGLTALELECLLQECAQATELRLITAGSISASPVPIPAALPLMLSALAAFGYLGWRRKHLIGG